MRNERYTDPDHFSAPVPTGTLSGAPVLVLGRIPAVTSTKEGEGGNIAGRASVQSAGVFTLPVADAVAAEGTDIFITPDNALTTTSGGSNVLFGDTLAAPDGTGATKAGGAGNVHIRLARA